MIIKELNHKPELKIKDCIVELSYEEVRDIANGMYWLTEYISNPDKVKEVFTATEKSNFEVVKNSFAVLFDLVKHGQIQQFTIDNCASPIKAVCPADCKGAESYTDSEVVLK